MLSSDVVQSYLDIINKKKDIGVDVCSTDVIRLSKCKQNTLVRMQLK